MEHKHTTVISDFCKSKKLLASAGELEPESCYSPQKALTLALSDWLEEFQSADQPAGRETLYWISYIYLYLFYDLLSKTVFVRLLAGVKKDSLEEEPMQTDMAEGPYVPGADENPLYTAEPLTLDDLTLLSDLFYLPYEHGPTARTMLQELDWLKKHSVVAAADTEQVPRPPSLLPASSSPR